MGLPESTIQHVTHEEPAATICPGEAEQVVALQQAGFVERNLEAGILPEQDERVLLLQLNRAPSDLILALSERPALEPCRQEMQAEGCPFVLASGAFIFVKPWQYQSAI